MRLLRQETSMSMKKLIAGAVLGTTLSLMFAGTVVTHGFWVALMAWGIAFGAAGALAWSVYQLTEDE